MPTPAASSPAQCINHHSAFTAQCINHHSAVHQPPQRTGVHQSTAHHSASQCITVHHSASQCITVHHSASQCITAHHSASQRITVHHVSNILLSIPALPAQCVQPLSSVAPADYSVGHCSTPVTRTSARSTALRAICLQTHPARALSARACNSTAVRHTVNAAAAVVTETDDASWCIWRP